MLLSKKMTVNHHPAIFALSLSLLFLLLLDGPPAFGANKQSRQLRDALTYLKSVPGIVWFEIEANNVVLGWKGYPSNFAAVNRTAAKKTSRKVSGEIKIYSVKENQRGWRPKKDAPAHLCHSLGKGGQLQFTNCR